MHDFLVSIGLTDSSELLNLTKTGLRIAIIVAVAFIIKMVAGRLITNLKSYLKIKAEDNLEEYKRIENTPTVVKSPIFICFAGR